MNTETDNQAAIIALMEEEHRLCSRLLAVAEAQRQALLLQDVETLPALVREMEGIGSAVEQIEAGRLEEMARFTGSSETTSVPLSTVVGRFTGPDRTRVEQLRDDLAAVIQRVHTVNQSNAALVRRALDITEQQAHLLEAAVPATYSTTGARMGPEASARAWWA